MGKTTGCSLVSVRTETGVEQGDSGCLSHPSAAVTKCHDQGSLPTKVLIWAQGSGGRDKSSPSWWGSKSMGTGSWEVTPSITSTKQKEGPGSFALGDVFPPV